MNSREQILARLKSHLSAGNDLPEPVIPGNLRTSKIDKLKTVLTGIGGHCIHAENWADVVEKLRAKFPSPGRWLNTIPQLETFIHSNQQPDPHLLEDVTLGVMKGHFAVAENGAVWITSDQMGDRALPFICEHLALVINESDVLPTMYEAYEFIADSKYDFATFIAGPSKTADIEQSLVLGAHGPKTLTLILLSSV
ncbi:MAG: LUD domain-containing protein [Chryseolinea sp.]